MLNLSFWEREPQKQYEFICSQIQFSSSSRQTSFQPRARKTYKVTQLMIVVRQLTNKSQIPLTTDILFGDAVAETAFKTCEGSWEIAVVASMRNMKAI